jgi:hypothetical protein
LCCSIFCHISELLSLQVVQLVIAHIENHVCMLRLPRNAPGRSFTKLSCSQSYFWGVNWTAAWAKSTETWPATKSALIVSNHTLYLSSKSCSTWSIS